MKTNLKNIPIIDSNAEEFARLEAEKNEKFLFKCKGCGEIKRKSQFVIEKLSKGHQMEFECKCGERITFKPFEA